MARRGEFTNMTCLTFISCNLIGECAVHELSQQSGGGFTLHPVVSSDSKIRK